MDIIENRAAPTAAPDLIRGARGIGQAVGISEAAAAHLLRRGALPAARKVGAVWWCERSRLLRAFGVTDDTHSTGAIAPLGSP
jgi:hypothetical protein